MSEFYAQAVRDHSLIAVLLGLIFLLVLPLGVLHTLRIFGSFLLVTLREFKHEIAGIYKVVAEVRREFRTWKIDK